MHFTNFIKYFAALLCAAAKFFCAPLCAAATFLCAPLCAAAAFLSALYAPHSAIAKVFRVFLTPG